MMLESTIITKEHLLRECPLLLIKLDRFEFSRVISVPCVAVWVVRVGSNFLNDSGHSLSYYSLEVFD